MLSGDYGRPTRHAVPYGRDRQTRVLKLRDIEQSGNAKALLRLRAAIYSAILLVQPGRVRLFAGISACGTRAEPAPRLTTTLSSSG